MDNYSCWRVARWLWKKHKQPSWKRLRRRELRNWEIRSRRGYRSFDPQGYRWNAIATVTHAFPHHGRIRFRHPPTCAGETLGSVNSRLQLWTAGCVETRTCGSEGGAGKRTDREVSRTPCSDPYITDRRPLGHLFFPSVAARSTRGALVMTSNVALDG